MSSNGTAAEPRIVIVGSGPVGSTYARLLLESLPAATVLMVDLGPVLTETPGMNVRNLLDPDAKAVARHAAQGPQADSDQLVELGIPASVVQEGTLTARQGTHLIDFGGPGSGHSDGFDAASASTAVGGQGTQWTCATPRPEFSERIPFIDANSWQRIVARAEELLHVTKNAFAGSPVGAAMLSVLREEFTDLPEGFGPAILPVAGNEHDDGTVTWTGADTVLNQLLDPASAEGARFELRPLTLARSVARNGSRVTGVLLEDAITGEQRFELADIVVLAADALRTPQLLWASGIRPTALGHYLTEHPTVVSRVALNRETMLRFATDADLLEERRRRGLNPADPVSGVIRIPFSEPDNLMSGQIMFTDQMAFGADADAVAPDNEWGYANVGGGLRKFPRFEDAVTFDDAELDYRGFPNMTIHYRLTEQEEREIAAATEIIRRAARALGDFVPGSEPRLLPNGSSFHYMGTMRIGESDDGTNVCGVDSRPWGFDNLYLGGNGLIPTANTVNPTLTSVALAVLGAESIVAQLS